MRKTCLFAFVHLNGCNFRQAQKCASPLKYLTYIDLLLGKYGIKLTASRQQRKCKGALTQPGTRLQHIILNNFNLGADHLTFEGVMGDFRKKISYRQISKEKRSCKELPCKKNCLLTQKNIFQSGRCWKKVSQYYCMSGKKFLSPEFLGEKILTQTKSPIPLRTPSPIPSQKSNVRPG